MNLLESRPSFAPKEAVVQDKRMRLALPTPRRPDRRIFVIRGDLSTSTGYGQATRNLAYLLRESFELYGVDLYPEGRGDPHVFPGRMIDDEAVTLLCARSGVRPIILHYTTPEGFKYFHSAINIGSFYWETSRLPVPLRWRELIDSMDFMWAPSQYVKGLIEAAGYRRPVAIVTWPFDFSAENVRHPRALREVKAGFIHYISPIPVRREQADFRSIRDKADFLFLSVKSLAPRKGLPILLTEWRDYIANRETHDVLLLKLRFVHNLNLGVSPQAYLEELVCRAGFRDGERVNIAYIVQDLSPVQLTEVFQMADAYVTASYGEGFGGPIVESLIMNTPVISGRHTGVADLLAADYPLAFPSKESHVGLVGNLPVYPRAATWELPVRGGVRTALDRVRDMEPSQRDLVVASARAYAARFCSKESVSIQLTSFFDGVRI